MVPLGLATYFQSILVRAFWEARFLKHKITYHIIGFSSAICLFHPLYVIAARVQYSVHYPTQELRDANKNTYRAFKTIKNTYGFKGFYKGFIP
jgi:hypothetical protein